MSFSTAKYWHVRSLRRSVKWSTTRDTIITPCTLILHVRFYPISIKCRIFWNPTYFSAPANATCLPRIGVFLYYDRFANYSEANAVCRRPHSQGGSAGTLAHILSAQRTNALSALIKSQRNTTRPGLAYVGLNQTEPLGPLYTSNAERFDCFLFRAWAPNHPRLAVKQAGCASVTAERSWKWHTCAKQLPFVCEVHTSRLAGRRAVSVTGKCPKIT